MKTVSKKVYYCDFCKKKGLSRRHMEDHEAHCTHNPGRKCGLCDLLGTANDIPALVAKYKPLVEKDDNDNPWIDVEPLDKELFGYGTGLIKQEICPVCKLAVLHQIGVQCWNVKFDYKKANGDAMAIVKESRWEGVGQ